jgi:hypothetical protein
VSEEPSDALISDADVLIDIAGADMEVLGIMAKFWRLHVAPDVLREVKSLTPHKAKTLGLIICEPTLEEYAEASIRGGPLSSNDKLCFAIARRRQWTCLTNDNLLRRECDDANVIKMWGLEAMVKLHKAGLLTKAHAIRTATAIHTANSKHISAKLLARFQKELAD